MSLEDLEKIETTNWTPQELSILKSQKNIFRKHCNAYAEVIKGIQDRHSGILRDETPVQQ